MADADLRFIRLKRAPGPRGPSAARPRAGRKRRTGAGGVAQDSVGKRGGRVGGRMIGAGKCSSGRSPGGTL